MQTKPHGHGDVHSLLHSSGLAKQWHKDGLKWVCFFQVCVCLYVIAFLFASPSHSQMFTYNLSCVCVCERCSSLCVFITVCLQDTNALVFRGLVAALGVSARHDYDMNSLAVPRKAQEVCVCVVALVCMCY